MTSLSGTIENDSAKCKRYEKQHQSLGVIAARWLQRKKNETFRRRTDNKCRAGWRKKPHSDSRTLRHACLLTTTVEPIDRCPSTSLENRHSSRANSTNHANTKAG